MWNMILGERSNRSIGFVCVAIVTLYLSVTRKIDVKLTVSFLIFSIISGLAIANHDAIKRIRYKDAEIETFERQVNQLKESALQEIQKDVTDQKKALGQVAETLIKMGFVLSDGSGRWDGMPPAHQKTIEEYKASLHQYINPNLDKEIQKTIHQLNSQTKKESR
jgi:hypothetical protein